MSHSSRDRRRRRSVRSDKDGIPIHAPGAPIEGSDAGEASDLRGARMAKTIGGHRATANRHFATAKRLAGHSPSAAEVEARQAITAAAKAFWWAEGSELEEQQHELMHTIGRWTRQHFGCSVHFDGKEYKLRCPIAIAHKRLGFSIAFTAKRICSVCGQDLSECPHMPDRTYWVRGGPGTSGRCPVCIAEECRHRHDRLYRASVVSIVNEVRRIRDVSMVRQPAVPEARLTEIPISTEGLVEHLGSAFMPGMPVSCDRCLGDCPGFDEFSPPSASERAGVRS